MDVQSTLSRAEEPIFVSEKPYNLDKGDLKIENDRLHHNHFKVFNPLTAGLLPAHILERLRSGQTPVRVADLCTGTGVWLQSLSKELPPDSILDGYDLSAAKFIASEDLPSNITLSTADVLEPFPADIQGKYDVVHIRLLVLALLTHQWSQVLRNVQTLLKPGGWILWEETAPTMQVSIPPSIAWQRFVDMDMKWAKGHGRDMMQPWRLPTQIKEAGYVNCDFKLWHSFISEYEIWENMRPAAISIMRAVLSGIVGAGGVDGMQTLEDLEDLVAAAEADMASGTEFAVELLWVWGQKRLEE